MNDAKWTIGAALLTCSFAVFAQPGEADKDWMEWRLERLEKRLDLTAEQKPKVEAILREQRQKMRTVHEQTRERLKQVLTPEQAEKFERLREEKKERWRQHLRQRFSRP